MKLLDIEVVDLLLFLLPGFLAAWVFYALTAYPKDDNFERVIEALIFVGIIQFLTKLIEFAALGIGTNPCFRLGVWDKDTFVVVSGFVGLIFGFVLSVCVNNEIPHRYFPRWVTKRTSAPSEWYSAFNSEERWVILHLAGERRLRGWAREWPDNPKEGFFILECTAWLTPENEQFPTYMTQQMLLNVKEVEMVEFEFDLSEVKTPEDEQKRINEGLISLNRQSEPKSEAGSDSDESGIS